MFRKSYRNEVELVGQVSAKDKERILELYELKAALCDEHVFMFDINRETANRLYAQIRALEDQLETAKKEAGVQLRYRR